MQPLNRRCIRAWIVLFFCVQSLGANAQLHCLPTGNHAIVPGNSFVITAGVGQIPPGSYVDNYKIWVNGVPYNGSTYTLVIETPYGGWFVTNPAIPCGTTETSPGFSFNFHQMTYWAGIFDGAIAYPYSDGEHPWTLSIGYSQGQQFSTLVGGMVKSRSTARSRF